MDRPWAEITEGNPIAAGLDSFRISFRSRFQTTGISSTSAALRQLNHQELQNLAITLLSMLCVLPAARIF
ncbi:uncharacterized protein UV8b_03285 [Ustilaginoidea virens]|uniref:Uncharacterized protein n=1 Tax=Ustilaginoidea virens TaxID=1159556 RepID=A0A8E5HPB6_USTVR|nr:uncharacterized protein UV8b_03285 [Ustilaginoidea virens]QUC19044.1 hypothetical protein UV8b_03285 [Ustilaginoidea virens]